MAVYLVDFENVTSAGLSGIQKLTKEDKVYIFYTVNASNMSFAAHMNLLSSAADVTYYNVASGGKNALDFQLSSFLGYLICQGKEKKFCIISNDRGYEYVKTFWERNGIAADISISGAPSINRSLLPMERPYSSRVLQNNTKAPEEKLAASSAPAAAIEENAAASQTPSPAASVIEEKSEEAKTEAKTEEVPAAETAAPEPAPKKRGRPKGKTVKETAAKTTAAKTNAPKAAAKEDTAKPAATEPKQKQKSEAVRTDISPDALRTLKTALAKANVTDENNVSCIVDLLKNTAGKQQFYHGILKIFGMERGGEVYKVIRPEYTNLTKLIK